MDVIQILVFLAIIGWGLSQTRRQKQKGRAKTAGKMPPADLWPVEEEAVDEEMPEPVPAPEPAGKQKAAAVRPSGREARGAEMPEKKERRPEVTFRNAADARRAFIYSEVFRRKYE